MRTKLTKKLIEAAEPGTSQRIIWDTEVKGLGLRITPAGAKSFIVQRRVRGSHRERRITIGRFGAWTVDQARKKANSLIVDLDDGTDVVVERKKQQAAEQAASVTLRDAWKQYQTKKRRKDGKPLKASTIEHIDACLERNFSDWLDTPLAKITRRDVERRHAEMAKRSPAQADQSFRYLRAIYGHAHVRCRDESGKALLPDNPVAILTDTGAWHEQKRRQDRVPLDKLGAFVNQLEHEAEEGLRRDARTAADFVLFLLYTGLRKGEASALTWKAVDLEAATITLPDPKNRKTVVLPLSSEAARVVKRRKAVARAYEAHVFPGRRGGAITDPRGLIANVCERIEAERFTVHGLRRTFASIGEDVGIGRYSLKRLLNHVIGQDVTAGYVSPELESLRRASEKVAEFITERAEVAAADNVVPMEARA